MTVPEQRPINRVRRIALGALVALTLLGARASLFPPSPAATDYPPGPTKTAAFPPGPYDPALFPPGPSKTVGILVPGRSADYWPL
jgi:hypothetical protein